jgi:hypothetical protein
MILTWVSITLTCDWKRNGACAMREKFEGIDKTHAIANARRNGWSVNGDYCRCPLHKGLRGAK